MTFFFEPTESAGLPNIFLLGMEGDILVPLLQVIEVNNLPHPVERNGFMGGNPSTFESSPCLLLLSRRRRRRNSGRRLWGKGALLLLKLTNVVLFCAWHPPTLRQQEGPQPVTRRKEKKGAIHLEMSRVKEKQLPSN